MTLSAASCVLTITISPVTPASAAGYTCFGETATIVGTPGRDTLIGTPGPDVIVGLDGNDLIDGLAGDDLICGGPNQAVFQEDEHEDPVLIRSEHLEGDEGNDRIDGGPGFDNIGGGDGDDRLYSGPGQGEMDGGPGDDVLFAGDDGVRMSGGYGADVGYGGDGDDTWLDGIAIPGTARACTTDRSPGAFYGRGGDDDVDLTGDGDYRIYGGSGRDIIRSSDGDDRLVGGAGDDTIAPDDGDDVVLAGAGVDLLDYSEDLHLHFVDPVFDQCGSRSPLRDAVSVDLERGVAVGVTTGIGTDEVRDAEEVSTGAGDDIVIGTAGPNKITGGAGNDVIRGLGGSDVIDGGAGRDVVDGGDGQDLCTDTDSDPDTVRGMVCQQLPQRDGVDLAARADRPATGIQWWPAVGIGAGGAVLLLGIGALSRRPWRRRRAAAPPR